MGRVIGIDLGTTNSCVAVLENGQPSVIPNSGGYKTTPSMFAITQDGKRLVGHLAKRQAITNAKNTVFAAKRLIGRRFDSPEVQRSAELCAYEITRGANDDARIDVGGKTFTCPEISAFILREMRRVAEEYLGEPVSEAVITVPAYFNDAQRQCTKDAGKIAGLEVLRIVNEPTAAAMAYGMNRTGHEKLAVYDLGGGTFDISVLEMSEGVIEVLATAGNTFLGGEDFDRRIVEHLLEALPPERGHRPVGRPDGAAAPQGRRREGEVRPVGARARRGEPALHRHGQQRPACTSRSSSRARRSSAWWTTSCAARSRSWTSASRTPGSKREELDQVILVGGQTRMPLVQQAVAECFGKRPHKGVNPDEVVAVGAAIQGETLVTKDENLLLLDVTPLSLGIATFGGHFAKLIERNTTVPVCKSHIFTTTRDNQSAVKIRVLQGESDVAQENDLLGEFVLSGIRPARKGEPEIEVSFDIDANGIVSASARDQATGKEQSITVNATGTLSEDEIQKIIEEQELYEVQLKE